MDGTCLHIDLSFWYRFIVDLIPPWAGAALRWLVSLSKQSIKGDVSGHVNGLITALSIGWTLTIFIANSKQAAIDRFDIDFSNFFDEYMKVPTAPGDGQVNAAYERLNEEFARLNKAIMALPRFGRQIATFAAAFAFVMLIKVLDGVLAAQSHRSAILLYLCSAIALWITPLPLLVYFKMRQFPIIEKDIRARFKATQSALDAIRVIEKAAIS